VGQNFSLQVPKPLDAPLGRWLYEKAASRAKQAQIAAPSGNTTQSGEKFPSDSGIPATTVDYIPRPFC